MATLGPAKRLRPTSPTKGKFPRDLYTERMSLRKLAHMIGCVWGSPGIGVNAIQGRRMTTRVPPDLLRQLRDRTIKEAVDNERLDERYRSSGVPAARMLRRKLKGDRIDGDKYRQ